MKTLATELGEDRLVFKGCEVAQTNESEGAETENRSVGGSIPPLGTTITSPNPSATIPATDLSEIAEI